MRFIDNGVVRVGVDLDKGGSIVSVAKHGGPNMINSADLGRQIQLSFYSGPVPFKPHGKEPSKDWSFLGWNPIQTGDCFHNPSQTLEFRSSPTSLQVKCIPMQWPLDNEPGECTFTVSIKLEGNVILVHNRLDNHRADATQWPARMQELPAIYTNAPWFRLMTYSGDRPFTGGELKQETNVPPASTFPWVTFPATENWTALVDAHGEGIGVIEPGCQTMSGGFFGKPGVGGPEDGPTGYIAPNLIEILDANIGYDFDYALVVGNLKNIRDYAYAHVPHHAIPRWQFERDRQHWYYANAEDTGWPIHGALDVKLEKDDPQLIGPPFCLDALACKTLLITAAFKCSSPDVEVFFSTFASPGFSEARRVAFKSVPDGAMRTYRVDLGSSPAYVGTIIGLRIDPEPAGLKGDYVRVRSIAFAKPS